MKMTPMMARQDSTRLWVSLMPASAMLTRIAPIQAPRIELRPPTAAQTTMVIEKERSMKVGEANSATLA